jgi:hypothetical protein
MTVTIADQPIRGTRPGDCPPWCVDGHEFRNPEDDRIHVGGYDAVSVNVGEEDERQELLVRLERGFPGQGRQTRIGLVYGDDYLDLTPAAAMRLAGKLFALAWRALCPRFGVEP